MMTYEQFYEVWQEVPDEFFQHIKERICNNGSHGHHSCSIAKFIKKFVSCDLEPDNSAAERHCCIFCWLRIQDYGIKNTCYFFY